MNKPSTTAEEKRLAEAAKREKNWQRWGTYLSHRQWGTVREDYSADGRAWEYFTHDDARSRAYRWGEDGLLGICDRECRLCFSMALWNGCDPILKERPFGLSNPQGNHGEDVKECYYFLEATPTHSYAKALYKYPQAEFPYQWLIDENAKRNRDVPEFELEDTGVFDENRYFDVFVEYAKAAPDDLLIRITAANRGPEKSTLHILPTLWFRNNWSWDENKNEKPQIKQQSQTSLLANHKTLGEFELHCETEAKFLFTENETDAARLFHSENSSPFVKDAFHEFVVSGNKDAVNPDSIGTKAAPHYEFEIPAGESITLRLRLSAKDSENSQEKFGEDFEAIFKKRIEELDEFYDGKIRKSLSAEEHGVARQAYAGLLWSKQFYYYPVGKWLKGDMPPPPHGHAKTRNSDWQHLYSRDVLSMPDNWEYPWFAAWDLAFHMIPMAEIDPEFAKHQLQLLLREWYMNPKGQIPAYEWGFDSVNPPVHAWACWRVYKIAAKGGGEGKRDRLFLERCFQKLMVNFTWWVNREDPGGDNVFSGGFLGLDNIGLFDRSKSLPNNQTLEEADATAWVASFCGTMLIIALELAKTNPAYEDIASKFFEHFTEIADAMNWSKGNGLWNEEDGFYYDHIVIDGNSTPLRVRSLVGLIPLIVTEVIDMDCIKNLPGFQKRLDWFLKHRSDLGEHICFMERQGHNSHEKRMLAIPSKEKLLRVLSYMLDENEFLAPNGIRSLSRAYREKPYSLTIDGQQDSIDYEPASSRSNLFGGNSNWRGPVWFPVNYLLIEALERYHHFYGDDLKVDFPTGSGNQMTLQKVANELSKRLSSIFLRDENGHRPCYGGDARYASDPHWRDLVLFNEYFHGENGRGLGASHQTGWTSLVTRCLSTGNGGK